MNTYNERVNFVNLPQSAEEAELVLKSQNTLESVRGIYLSIQNLRAGNEQANEIASKYLGARDACITVKNSGLSGELQHKICHLAKVIIDQPNTVAKVKETMEKNDLRLSLITFCLACDKPKSDETSETKEAPLFSKLTIIDRLCDSEEIKAISFSS
jgi:hypothetical protein